jgi:hypothetical protein
MEPKPGSDERWGELEQDTCSSGVVCTNPNDPSEPLIAASKVALLGVQFRTTQALLPGTVRHLRIGERAPRLASEIRIISCRPRSDGYFDIRAEFF